MLASPLYPTPISSQQPSEEATQYRPAENIEAFNKLLAPRVEFIEGSSSGTLAFAEGRYEPINGSPKPQRREEQEPPEAASQTRVKSPKPNGNTLPLFTGPLNTSWPRGASIGAGLNNTGNTCFLNSALQCLLHTPPLLHALIAHKKEHCHVKGFCMICALRYVMTEAHTGKKRSFTPFSVTSRLQTIAQHMRRGRQEDSHEFLRYAIDALQKSCLAGHPSKIDPKQAETTWVHNIFGGKLRSRVTCRDCAYNSDTFDSILDLSVDIHGLGSLRDALRKFVAVDYLKGSDKYKCEKCKRHVVAEKHFTIHEAPVALTVHLKRFSPLGRKIGHAIRYDERISLAPFMSDGQFGPSYSLYGVISHAGGGPNSGHYFAHVKAANGQWYEMNDDSVTRHGGAPTSLKNAYILFYLQDKGQALEAAVTRETPRINSIRNGLVAGMRKRKIVESEDEDEDEDEVKGKKKQTQPFIGPVLPKSPIIRDPQAEALKRKIEAAGRTEPASKKPSTSVRPSTALQNIAQYDDTDEADGKHDDDNVEDDDKEDLGERVSDPRNKQKEAAIPSTQGATESSPPVPPTSSPLSSSSASIPPESFYGQPTTNGKKRKSHHLDEGADTPRSAPRTSSSGRPAGVNPWAVFGGKMKHPTKLYGRKKRMIM